MAKYNKKIAQKIFDLIEKDSYTIAQICNNVGISERTFTNWQNGFAEFADGIARARETFIKTKLVECEKSLDKLINGYEYDEVKTVMVDNGSGNPKIRERTVIKKQVIPSLPAIAHFQTNRAPESWRNRQTTELTGKDGKDLIPDRPMTMKEAKKFLEQITGEI